MKVLSPYVLSWLKNSSSEEVCFKEMKILEQVMTPAVTEFINHPKITPSEKWLTLKESFEKLGFSPTTLNFFKLIIEKSRYRIFTEILKVYPQLIREYFGTFVVKIIWALPPSEADSSAIKNILITQYPKTKWEWEENVDPSLRAGCIVKINHLVIDGSLKFFSSTLLNL